LKSVFFLKGFLLFLFDLVDISFVIFSWLRVYKLKVKEIKVKEKVKVCIKGEVKVNIKEETEVGIKGETKVGIKGEIEVSIKEGIEEDTKKKTKIGIEEAEIVIAKMFRFYAKTSCNFRDFKAIEW